MAWRIRRRACIFLLLVICALCPVPAGAAVRVAGTRFVQADGRAFAWRGVTAFRLLEQVASGHDAEARAFLDWCRGQDVTVVRVLAMAKHAFELPPARGLAALPKLLQMASSRGVHVEVVALADTGSYPMDLGAQVEAVGKACAAAGNCLIEIANEPYHATQVEALHDRETMRRLRDRVPRDIPVALGAAQDPKDSGGGDYATVHMPRDTDQGGWGHVVALAQARMLTATLNMPVVSDEPIGAAAVAVAGRRDNDPARFRAAALVTRLAGMGATFHFEDGIQARIPAGRELECFVAWNEAWNLLPPDIERTGVFRLPGEPGAAVASFSPRRAAAVFERQRGDEACVLVLGTTVDPGLVWAKGWRVTGTRNLRGVRIVTVRRLPGQPRNPP